MKLNYCPKCNLMFWEKRKLTCKELADIIMANELGTSMLKIKEELCKDCGDEKG